MSTALWRVKQVHRISPEDGNGSWVVWVSTVWADTAQRICRQGLGAAILTFLPSYSCSCCHPWIPGWPGASSSSSSPLLARSPCFSGQCSVAFYLLLLQRQKSKGTTVLSLWLQNGPASTWRLQVRTADRLCSQGDRGRGTPFKTLLNISRSEQHNGTLFISTWNSVQTINIGNKRFNLRIIK